MADDHLTPSRDPHDPPRGTYEQERMVGGGHRRLLRWAFVLGVLALAAVTIALVIPNQDRRWRGGRGDEFSGGPGPNAGAVGTGGSSGGPGVGTLGNVISDVRSLGGAEDLQDLIGREVELEVDLGTIGNDVAFWTGEPPNQILVAMSRDTRSGLERQVGVPSTAGFQPQGRAVIRGVIEPVPYAEATYSWALTRRDIGMLADRGAYLRAHSVRIINGPETAAPPR